ncbi:ribonuclease J [Kushneria phyllosphaerae]|uniref:Ribonuclease J 1 n=1 Tax=Kushneria phyllosphaerae TaxID=2100822 RepID=A0A2R8CPX7_9GAMM|nr:ribonuclease J [Kushneria phyllosphaerae]SPJ34919.1 Ribonuclease J 1 [Kushneria phyllosphaerae]
MDQTRVQVRPRRRSEIEILPLGGCGEIGMNLMLYGFQSRWLIVDCGMALRQDLHDTPLQIPDVSSLATLGIQPEAIVITHGHEDHLGALGWLWPRFGCPIYATPLAAGIARQKLVEQGLATDAIRTFTPGTRFNAGPFSIQSINVAHSIPESVSLLLEVDRHRILHTGDWKIDPHPVLGAKTREEDFTSIAPVDLVVGDSTNAMVENHSHSESEVAATLEQLMGGCEGRIVVSCFASNLARILATGLAARRHHRRIALLGRAMEKMVRLGRELGYLDDFPDTVPLSDIGYLPPEEILILATGSQGEPRAALSRLAANQHSALEIEPGDCIIFSSRAIPGNERAVMRLQQAFTQRGAHVYSDEAHPGLHASGHPGRDELLSMYQWVKPSYLLPVHGENAHQKAHCEIAATLGIESSILPINGQWLRWNGKRMTLESTLTLSPVIISQRKRAKKPSNRHNNTVIVLPVIYQADTEQWQRVGRILIDSQVDTFVDEETLGDWVDITLEGVTARSSKVLSHLLEERANHWLREQLRQSSRITIDIVDTTLRE